MKDKLLELRKATSGRKDWRSRYVRLALKRLEMRLDLTSDGVDEKLQELETLLESRPSEKEIHSPQKALLSALDSQLKQNLKVASYEKLGVDPGLTWDAIREAMTLTVTPSESKATPVATPEDRSKTALTLQILSLIAQIEGKLPTRDVRAHLEELRQARESPRGADKKLQKLLKRLDKL